MTILSIEQDAKTRASCQQGYLVAIVYMNNAQSYGEGVNLCENSTSGCERACLYDAGRGAMDYVKAARRERTRKFLKERTRFVSDLTTELYRFERIAATRGLLPAVRLNGTTDLRWEAIAPSLFQSCPSIQYYDYTKTLRRLTRSLHDPAWPPNYYLAFSRSEMNAKACEKALGAGASVCVVVESQSYKRLILEGHEPSPFPGYEMVDGDKSDLRFLDPSPCVVLLKAKGKALHDRTGFVLRQYEQLALEI